MPYLNRVEFDSIVSAFNKIPGWQKKREEVIRFKEMLKTRVADKASAKGTLISDPLVSQMADDTWRHYFPLLGPRKLSNQPPPNKRRRVDPPS